MDERDYKAMNDSLSELNSENKKIMKKTLQECKEIVAKEIFNMSFNSCLQLLSQKTLEELFDHVYKMYYGQSEWISVKDALPECGIEVLTYGGWGMLVDSYEMTLLDGTIFFKGNKEYNNSEVTHWQPLPKQPEI